MKTMTLSPLGRRLRAARTLKGYDQAAMSVLLGVGRSTISDWERGETEPNVGHFIRWAEITGQSMEWLAEGYTPRDSNPELTGLPGLDSNQEPIGYGLERELAFWAIVYGPLLTPASVADPERRPCTEADQL